MASRCIWQICNPNPEISAQGRAEGRYQGVRVVYSPYTPRRHSAYSIVNRKIKMTKTKITLPCDLLLAALPAFALIIIQGK